MEIYFCERCGKRVSDVDLEKGHGVLIDDLVYCDACATEEGLYEVARQAEQAPQAQAARTSARRSTTRLGNRNRPRPARQAPEEGPPEGFEAPSATPKWIYGVIFGSALILVLALFFAFGRSDKASRPTPAAAKPSQSVVRPPEPAPTPSKVPAQTESAAKTSLPAAPQRPPAGKSQGQSSSGPAFKLNSSPSGLRPAGALVLADFDYVPAAIDGISGPHKAEIKDIDGNQAVVIYKQRGDIKPGALLKLRFSKPVDLSSYKTLSLNLVAGPGKTRVNVALNKAGSLVFLKTPDGADNVVVGPHWEQFDFVLPEGLDQVYGLAIKFNAAARGDAFLVSADEILAYGKGDDILAQAPKSSLSASSVQTGSQESPAGTSGDTWGKVTLLDFETPVKFYSKYGQPAEITRETAHSGDACLKVRVEPGMKNSHASRIIITLPAPADFSRAKGLEFFVKAEGTGGNRGALSALDAQKEFTLPLADRKFSEWQFDYKDGDWQRIYFPMDPSASLRNVSKVAVYFNYKKKDGPFTFYLDDVSLTDYVPAGKVLYSENFDNGPGGWRRGVPSTETTPNGSGQSFKAEPVEGDSFALFFPTLWYEAIGAGRKSIFEMGKRTWLQFDYLAKNLGKDSVKILVSSRNGTATASGTFPIKADGKWRTLRVDLASPQPETGGKPQPGTRIQGIKIYAGKSGAADASFFIDNVLIEEVPEPARVLLAWDFENGLGGWSADTATVQKLPDGRSVLKATGTRDAKYFSNTAVVASYKWKPGAQQLFTYQDDLHFRMDYYVTNVGNDDGLLVVLFGGTAPRGNYRYRVENVETGKWSHIDVPLKAFTAWVEGRPHLKPGDPVSEIKIWTGNPGKDVTLMLDNVRIVKKSPAPSVAAALAAGSGTGPAAPRSSTSPKTSDESEAAKTITEPTKTTGVSGGEAIVLFFSDFESGSDGWTGGERITGQTFNNSSGAFKAKWNPKAQYFPCSIGTDKWKQNKEKAEGFFQIGGGTKIAFAYYLTGADYIQIQFWNTNKDNNFFIRKKAQQGVWTVMEAPFLEAQPNARDGTRTTPGDWVKSLSLYTGSKTKETVFIVDNVLIYEGDLPADMGSAIAKKIAETKALTGNPMTDGFYLNGEVLANLKSYYKKDKVVPKTVAVLGDDLANALGFIAPLTGKKGPLAHLSMVPKVTFVSSRAPLPKLYSKLERGLKRRIPETFFIMAGYSDITRYRLETGQMTAEMKKIVEKILSVGSCPVLVTLPRLPKRTDPFAGKFGDWNQALITLAQEKRIPLIEAAITLNRQEKKEKFFSSSGKLRRPGYDIINDLALKVYRAMEYKVFERGVPPVQQGAPAGPGASPAGRQQPSEDKPEEIEEIENIQI